MSGERVKAQIEALDKSIEHWERMLADPLSEADSPYSEECACCQRYFSPGRANPCVGCPIFEHTGVSGCSATPFAAAADAIYDLRDGYDQPSVREKEACAELIQEEIDFLVSLRARLANGVQP